MLGADWLRSSFAEEDEGVLVDTRLDMSCALPAEKTNSALGCTGHPCHQRHQQTEGCGSALVRHAGTTRRRNPRVVPGSFVKRTGEVRYDRKDPWHLSAKNRATTGSLYRTRMTVDIKTWPFVGFGCCQTPASKRDAKHTPEFRRFSFRCLSCCVITQQ